MSNSLPPSLPTSLSLQGDAAGLGKVRAQELAAAWPALLGRRAAGTVTVVDHPGLQVRAVA